MDSSAAQYSPLQTLACAVPISGVSTSSRAIQPSALFRVDDLNACPFEVRQVAGRQCRALGWADGGDESIETCDRFPGPFAGAGDQRVLLGGCGVNWQDLLIEGPEGVVRGIEEGLFPAAVGEPGDDVA